MFVEFLVKRSPLSFSSRNTAARNSLKEEIRKWVSRAWANPPHSETGLHLSIVYFCREETTSVADVDNMIKPIQDALQGLVYDDDRRVTDVDSHRRSFREVYDTSLWPPALTKALLWQTECFYVRVKESLALEEHL